MCKPISRTLRKLVLFHLPTSDKAKITFHELFLYIYYTNSMLLDIPTSVLSEGSYHRLRVFFDQ